jgi:hypothetical protein
MKKYLFGTLAIVFAVGLVAFTTPNKARFVEYFFEYTAGVFNDDDPIELPSNWAIVSDFGLCSDNDSKACRIKVDAADTEIPAGETVRKLKSGTVIIAAQNGLTGFYYVTEAGDVVAKRNKN